MTFEQFKSVVRSNLIEAPEESFSDDSGYHFISPLHEIHSRNGMWSYGTFRGPMGCGETLTAAIAAESLYFTEIWLPYRR